MGGRLVVGVLKGYDQLMNLVLDETIEYMRDSNDKNSKDKTRSLGFTVIRGNILASINPMDGSEIIYMQNSAWNMKRIYKNKMKGKLEQCPNTSYLSICCIF